jgi:hypothetical protein
VLAALTEQGWQGVTLRHLNSARPLREIADRMHPKNSPEAGRDQ